MDASLSTATDAWDTTSGGAGLFGGPEPVPPQPD